MASGGDGIAEDESTLPGWIRAPSPNPNPDSSSTWVGVWLCWGGTRRPLGPQEHNKHRNNRRWPRYGDSSTWNYCPCTTIHHQIYRWYVAGPFQLGTWAVLEALPSLLSRPNWGVGRWSYNLNRSTVPSVSRILQWGQGDVDQKLPSGITGDC